MQLLQTIQLNKKTKYLLFLGLLTFVSVFIYYGFLSPDVADASLKSQILSNNQEQLEETANTLVSGAVKTAREIAFGVIFIVAIWIGYSILIKKSAEGLADVKGRLGVILLAIAFIFFAEQIIGTIFGWLGYKGE